MPEPSLYVYRDNALAMRNGARNLLGHCWAWYGEVPPSAAPRQAPDRIFELVRLARHSLPDHGAMPPVTGASSGRMEIDVGVPVGNPFDMDPPPALVVWNAMDGNGYTASFVEIPQLAASRVHPPVKAQRAG